MQRKIALVASNAPAAMEAEAELRPLYDFVELGEADMLIVLGGDGFLLHMLHQLLDQRRSLPVFGMNRGTIGFLMNEFRVEGLFDRIAGARPFLIHPLQGDITTISGERHILPAINEISLLRETRQAAKLEVLINEKQMLEELACDCVLVATPAAVIADGGLPTQRRIDGTLETIAALAESAAIAPPAVVVVGEVVHALD